MARRSYATAPLEGGLDMPKLLGLTMLAAAAASLGACMISPERDPHNLPYQWSLWPGNSPGVAQYSTNPYPALNAPPLNPGAAGAGAFP
jgi:hypothetical protein